MPGEDYRRDYELQGRVSPSGDFYLPPWEPLAADLTGPPTAVWIEPTGQAGLLRYHLRPIPGTGRLSYDCADPDPEGPRLCPLRPKQKKGREQRLTRRMLASFLRLRDARGVKRFAERYGVLGICPHGEPAPHESEGERCHPQRDEVSYFEPVSDWLRYARLFEAVLRLTAALANGPCRNVELWRSIYPHFMEDMAEWTAQQGDVVYQRVEVDRLVNSWLSPRVFLALEWRPDKDKGRVVTVASTFGSLALQLAAAITQVGYVALCDGCHGVYYPDKKPASGRRNFCESCRPRVATRLRVREWRLKRKRQREAQDSLDDLPVLLQTL